MSTALPPLVIEGEERSLVGHILCKEQHRRPGDRARRIYYRVRWQGNGPDEDIWETADDLLEQTPELVRLL